MRDPCHSESSVATSDVARLRATEQSGRIVRGRFVYWLLATDYWLLAAGH